MPGKMIRWRSREITRLEGFSDAVFAFAVTLLVISLEVPHTFAELMEKMHGFAAFAISFTLLFHIWFLQHKFFRRYGLQDTWTAVLNGVLLFVVLFFVYPLKFLFTFLTSTFSGGRGLVRLPDGRLERMVVGSQAETMMAIYGLGYVAVFAVFVLLYLHAYRKRAELELDEIEALNTRATLISNALNVGVGLLSITIVLIGGAAWAAASGMIYGLIGVAQFVFWGLHARKLKRLEAAR